MGSLIFLKIEKEFMMANKEAVSPEVHKRAAAVARTLMNMPPKPLKQSKKSKSVKTVKKSKKA